MNVLRHYIDKIYSEKDVTEDFQQRIGHKPHERLFLVDMEINCYGVIERVQKQMFETEWNFAKENGYYMA